MAENVWYYATGNMQHGPFTFEEMKAFAREGRFSGTDLVWEPSFGNRWRNAESVPGLLPAPAPAEEPPSPALSGTAPLPVEEEAPETARDRVPLNGIKGAKPSPFRAVSLAFRRMRDVLFVSCCFSRWLGLAFCSWCSALSMTPSLPYNTVKAQACGLKEFHRAFDSTYDELVRFFHTREGLFFIAGMACAVLFFTLLSFFLQSRGAFMFLHRWYHPDTRIRTVWQNSRGSANRLFRWETGFYLIFLAVVGAVCLYGYRAFLLPYLANGREWDAKLLVPLVRFGCSAAGAFLVYTSVRSINREFIVPVMYWQGCTVGAAWRSFFSLCAQHPFRLLGFYLLKYALFLAWVFVYALFVVGSLLIGVILLLLPFIGAVVLLPASFFFRGYSLAFIHQWRKDLVPLE